MSEQLTMDELYGDGSTHYACHKCGLCLHCGDCIAYGCGKKMADEIEALKAHIAQLEKWQQDGEKLLVNSAATPIRAAFNLGAWWADRPWRKR